MDKDPVNCFQRTYRLHTYILYAVEGHGLIPGRCKDHQGHTKSGALYSVDTRENVIKACT
jgi:hypothetical protein